MHGQNTPLQTSDSEFEALFRALRIPPAGPEIATAAEALRAAKEARTSAQARHREAGAKLASQKLGEAPTISHGEVDDLGAQIAPTVAAEEAAQAEFDRISSEYREAALSSLGEPLQRYEAILRSKLDELDAFLALGALLQTELAAAKLKLPSKLPSLCSHLLGQVVAMRAIMAKR